MTDWIKQNAQPRKTTRTQQRWNHSRPGIVTKGIQMPNEDVKRQLKRKPSMRSSCASHVISKVSCHYAGTSILIYFIKINWVTQMQTCIIYYYIICKWSHVHACMHVLILFSNMYVVLTREFSSLNPFCVRYQHRAVNVHTKSISNAK